MIATSLFGFTSFIRVCYACVVFVCRQILICTGAVVDYDCGGTVTDGPSVEMMAAATAERESQLQIAKIDIAGQPPINDNADALVEGGSVSALDQESKTTAPETMLPTSRSTDEVVTLSPNADAAAVPDATGAASETREGDGNAALPAPTTSSGSHKDARSSTSGERASTPATAVSPLAVADSSNDSRPLWSLTPVRCCVNIVQALPKEYKIE